MKEPQPTTERLAALDMFRGLTIAAMILVNNPGSWSHVYAPLRHASWHGWTPTDLVFPFFLFICGVAIPLAQANQLARGTGRGALLARTLRRCVVLFLLGLFLAGYPFVTLTPSFGLSASLPQIRIPGVLQRIAVCYGAAAVLRLWLRRRGLLLVVGGLLFGYWALLSWVPVPGYGAGRLQPPEATLTAWLDRTLLDGHLWRQSRTWDPEGILSTLPALGTTLLGVLVGDLIRGDGERPRKLNGLFAAGTALVCLGWLWDRAFPINKPLWTSSYAVFTAGQAMLGLAVCWWLADELGCKRLAKPFVIYGRNAITVFVLSGVLARTLSMIAWENEAGTRTTLQGWLHGSLFRSWLPPHAASLAYALAWVLGWFVVLSAMHRRGWFLKV